MQPIHKGLPAVGLYNGNAFRSVTVCLDSGKIATAACKSDVRQMDRLVTVNVYNGDEPAGTCDKHVQVEYCVTGGGVATEYCSKFEGVEIEARSLVKLTQDEVDALKRADNVGLNDMYTVDYYVYLVDGNWHGFYGNANQGVEAPYIVCPVHTQEAWEEYEQEQETEGGDGFEDWFDTNPDDDNDNNNSGSNWWN